MDEILEELWVSSRKSLWALKCLYYCGAELVTAKPISKVHKPTLMVEDRTPDVEWTQVEHLMEGPRAGRVDECDPGNSGEVPCQETRSSIEGQAQSQEKL